MLADFSCLIGNDFFSCLAIHDQFKADIPFENKEGISKVTLVLWALLCNPKIPFMKSEANQQVIDCHSKQFEQSVFPKRMQKSGRIKGF